MQEKIFELLFENDEISWQSIILNLIKTEEMDPWDIDISLLTRKYIEMLKKLREMDFRISGKVILAAAILLRIKSTRLVNEDIFELDRLMSPEDMEGLEEEFYDELEHRFGKLSEEISSPKPVLSPRTPQPRERKVSIYDLMDALQKALEVKRRRATRQTPVVPDYTPKNRIEITSIIKEVYNKISTFFLRNKNSILTFSQLIPSNTKKDKILTFIPLLHLTTQRKIDLFQEEHFGEIEIMMARAKANKETNKRLIKNKKINPSNYFVLRNGNLIPDLYELIAQLEKMDSKTFRYHVNDKKNDFAQWIEDVFGDKKLANTLRTTKNKDETISILVDALM